MSVLAYFSSANVNYAFSSYLAAIQIVNSTHVISNFTMPQGIAPGKYKLNQIYFIDYLYPYNKVPT